MVMRETLVGFQGGLQIGGRILTNLRYIDDIILLATSEAELQELVDRLDRVRVCVTFSLAVLVQYRRMTDGRTDKRTDT